MQVSPKVGNFPSKFGHAKIMYATDGRTEATLFAPFPTVGGYTQRLGYEFFPFNHIFQQFAKYREWANFAPSIGDQGLKSLHFQGASPPDLLTRASAPGPPLQARDPHLTTGFSHPKLYMLATSVHRATNIISEVTSKTDRLRPHGNVETDSRTLYTARETIPVIQRTQVAVQNDDCASCQPNAECASAN